MFENTRLRSPSQCGSRKVYDYLNDNVAASISKDRFLSGSKPRVINDLSPISKEQTEYELIVEFELRREKEKNAILEERLRHKESFIKQMKEFQDELTITFEKCQEELHYYKSQCQEYESRWNSFATFNNGIVENSNVMNSSGNAIGQNVGVVNRLLGENDIKQQQSLPSIVANEQLIRDYVEEIAELKHLVIRLEEEINYYEKREKSMGQNRYLSSSVKNEFFPNKGGDSRLREVESKNYNQQSPTGKNNNKKHKKYKPLESDKRQLRSKTLANEFVEEKKEENFTTLNKISDFINTETRKISSFINHFLTMCEFFEQSIEKEPSIKHKLKKAWKWIKTAIAEWNYLKKEKLEKVKEYKIGNIVTKMLPLANLSIGEIETLLEKILKPSQEYHSNNSMY